MGNKIWIPAIVLVVGVSSIATAVVAKPKPAPRAMSDEKALISVPISAAEPTSQRLNVTASGTAIPSRQISIVSEVAGRIVAINSQFETGGHFTANDWLVQIDPLDYELAVVAAKAKLADATRLLAEEKGRARQAKREWRDLGNQEANDLFVRKPQLASAQANVELAEAELAKAERNLSKTYVRLPFDGRIKSVNANIGQYVPPGAQIGSAFDSSALEIRVPLTEQQAALLELPFGGNNDAQVNVSIKGLVAGRQGQWDGRLARTDAYVDEQSRMYYAIIEVENPFENIETPLLPGLFVEVEIEGRSLSDVAVLPRSALFQKNTLVTVDAENRAHHKVVNVLNKTQDHIWVAGITKGEKVLLGKQALVDEGEEVSPKAIGDNSEADVTLTTAQ